MGTTLVICLFLATHLHAESIALSISTSTTAALVDSSISSADAITTSSEEDELTKIAATCLTARKYEQLTGNTMRHGVARSSFGFYLVRECVATIGIQELRAALEFAPRRTWQSFNRTEPSKGELAAAPTIEEYYDLREPRSWDRSLDSIYLLERNLIPAIAFLDERFPSIRTIFRRKFGAIRRKNPGVIDRKMLIVRLTSLSSFRAEYAAQQARFMAEETNAGM